MADTPQVARARINANGRIVIPKGMRRELGVRTGDEVLLRMEPEGMLVYTLAGAVAQIQRELRPFARPGVSIVDELIADRQAEFEREYGAEPEATRARAKKSAGKRPQRAHAARRS